MVCASQLRTPFNAGQRGIVLFRTFNEGEEVVKPSGRPQTAMDDRSAGRATASLRLRVAALRDRGPTCATAVLRHGDGAGQRPHPSTIKPMEAEPRMPAILDDERGGDSVWATSLGEDGATPNTARALLKTMKDVNWTAAPEPKKPRAQKP